MNRFPPDADPDPRGSYPVPMPVARAPAHRDASGAKAFLAAGPDVAALIGAVKRRWLLIASGGIAVGLLAAGAAFFLVPPPKYTVKSMIYIASTPARIIFQTSESIPEYRSYQRSQAILAKSRKVLTAALRQADVSKLTAVPTEGDPVSWLDREIKVDFPFGAEIMTITMTGANSHDASTLVNAVTDAYLKQIVEEERRDRVARYDSLKKLFNQLQDDLRGKRKEYRASIESVGVTDKLSVAARQQTATQNLGLLQVELGQLQGQIRQLQLKAKLAAATPDPVAAAEGPSAVALAETAVSEDREIAELKKARGMLEAEYTKVTRTNNRDLGDPSIQGVRTRLMATDRALRNRIDKVRAAAVRSVTRDAQTRGAGQQAEIEQTLAILMEQEQSLREQVTALSGDLKTGNVKVLDMNYLDDEIALTTQSARTVGSEVEALTVELAAQPRIRLVERAENPIQSDPMRRYKVSGGAGMACLALFAGAVVFLESRARRVGSTEEVTHGLGIRLIGSIPAQPRGRLARKAAGAWPQMLIESVDAARTLILHTSRLEPLKVILIASAVKGEGKTTLACLLSASLVRAGKRTLLIDGDLRCPAIHRLMDITAELGLCDLLRGDARFETVIVPAAGPGVDFIPAGKVDSRALQGLADGRLGDLLDSLRDHYDQIIIDSAPTLYVPDGLMMAQYVDTVLLAVLRDVSQAPKVHAAHERLADLNVRVLGAIVGGTSGEDSRGYAYQYARGPSRKPHELG